MAHKVRSVLDLVIMETISGLGLDTVRSLHQTVVSLREALELSRNELKDLKAKFEQHSLCSEYKDVIEKLSLENHVLRRKLIDTDQIDNKIDDCDIVSDVEGEKPDEENNTDNDESDIENSRLANDYTYPDINLKKTDDNEHFKTKLELLSKFDVTIKVKTLKEGETKSETETDSQSVQDESDKEELNKAKNKPEVIHDQKTNKSIHKEIASDSNGHNITLKVDSTENIEMAVPSDSEKNDKFDVHVKITSEENLVVSGIDQEKRSELNLDVDDLSLRSVSEGDNSVFSETNAGLNSDNRISERQGDNVSDNESEEVDDIELIFTTDDSKDVTHLQEDLVPIKDSDWCQSPSTHSTPVLIKYHTLDPDIPSGDTHVYNEKTKGDIKTKRVSLPSYKDMSSSFHGKSLELPSRGILKSLNRSDNVLNKRSPSGRKLDSMDSLSCEYRGMSFDTKSSSYDLGSSQDVLQSIESFNKSRYLGHRFSVFAERDISKCGTSQDDLMASLNIRRNTCPNPFQSRSPPNRAQGRSGPFKATFTPTRPILRDSIAVRRENAAQTDVSALPPRWSSDGYLAHDIVSQSKPTTLPLVHCAIPEDNPRYKPDRIAPHRRQLLSDIGFTSMVPELSRSADPLWEMEQRAYMYGDQSSGYNKLARVVPHSPMFCNVPSPNQDYYTRKSFWRSSMPDVRGDDTDDLLNETEAYLRQSVDNLRSIPDYSKTDHLCQPYIPNEPKNLRLGHSVKIITPQGRIAVGKVRYIGLAGGTSSDSTTMVGVIFPLGPHPFLPLNDGTFRGRRYFHAPPNHTSVFVPFNKVVMAWAN